MLRSVCCTNFATLPLSLTLLIEYISLQTILRNDAISGFLRPLKFTKIRSLGGKLGASIAQEYEAATVGDLW